MVDAGGRIGTARAAAARYLREGGYAAEASMAADGRGDDFAEVRMALSLLTLLHADGPKAEPAPHRRRTAGEEC